MRPNTIEILLTWLVGLALTTTCSPQKDVTPYLLGLVFTLGGWTDACARLLQKHRLVVRPTTSHKTEIPDREQNILEPKHG